MADTKLCPRCNGSGSLVKNGQFNQCPKCDANGVIEKGAHEKLPKEQRQALGTGGGAIAGFAAGGPVGAVIGGALGLLFSSDDSDEGVSGR